MMIYIMSISIKWVLLSSIIYTIAIILLFRFDPSGHFNMGNAATVSLTIFGTLLLGVLLILGVKKDIIYGFQRATLNGNNMKNIAKTLGVILGVMAVFFGFVALVLHFMRTPPTSNAFFTVMNVLIFVTTMTLLLYFIKDIEVGNPYFNLVKNVIMYIPCLFYDFIDWVKYQYSITTPTALIILGIDMVFILIQKLWTKMQHMYKHSRPGHTLLEGPLYIDHKHNIGTFEDLKTIRDSKNFSYHYGISFWLYINPQPPNTSEAYNRYCTVFDYGGKPKMLYKADENKLKVQVKMNDEDTKNIYLGTELKLQKWNHIIINYDRGTLDILLNDKLISSSSSIAPYMTLDAVSIGENNGIHGAIKDVVYFRKPLID